MLSVWWTLFVCLSVISYIILSLLWRSGDLSSLSANSNLLYELNWLTIYTNPHKISTINLQIWMRTWPKMASRVTSLLSIDILYQTYPKSNFPDTLKPPSTKSKLSKINDYERILDDYEEETNNVAFQIAAQRLPFWIRALWVYLYRGVSAILSYLNI